jgi:hypothetical protein
MAPPIKTVEQYEAEAHWEGECLVHPSIGAYRKVYARRHGKLAKGLCVCHTCDNPPCIREATIFQELEAIMSRILLKKAGTHVLEKAALGLAESTLTKPRLKFRLPQSKRGKAETAQYRQRPGLR